MKVVTIKDLQLPKYCENCPFHITWRQCKLIPGMVNDYDFEGDHYKATNCPLVEIEVDD